MPIRFTTSGESHGPGLTAIVEGLPAGLPLEPRGPRPRSRAAPARARPRWPDEDRDGPRGRRLGRAPRQDARQPGHDPRPEPRLRELGGADEPVAGGRRGRGGAPAATRATPTSRASRSSASRDVRNVLERASARETAARVACGALAKAFLGDFGVQVFSHVVQIGSVARPSAGRPRAGGLRCGRRVAGPLPRRGGERGDGGGDQHRAEGERVARRRVRGARVRARAGDRLVHLVGGPDGRPRWRQAIMSIQAMKGVERRRRVRRRRPRRLGGARRDLLVRGARLLPRDEPLRRARGRA